ncbi:Fc.00g092780.m01.CDS01 [Cosmosporella sp. VM-42]
MPTDGVYFLDCFRGNEFKRTLAYYKNIGENTDQLPDDIIDVFGPDVSADSRWEGFNGSATFRSGVTFSWTINGDARDQGDFSDVGSAANGFESFIIKKDREHTLFRSGDGFDCKTVYFTR